MWWPGSSALRKIRARGSERAAGAEGGGWWVVGGAGERLLKDVHKTSFLGCRSAATKARRTMRRGFEIERKRYIED